MRMNDIMSIISLEVKNVIEYLLDRSIFDEEANVSSFDKFSDHDIHDMSKLNDDFPLGCLAYVRFRMGNKVSINQAMKFIDDVVVDGMTAKDFYERNYGDHRGAIQE